MRNAHVCLVMAAIAANASVSLFAQPREVPGRSVQTWEIPDGVVFEHFLIHADLWYAKGDQPYRDYLELFAIDPDLPMAQDLPREYAAILEGVEAMEPQTGDIDLDNDIRTEWKATLLGDLFGRFVEAANANDSVPRRAELSFLRRLNEKLRPSVSMRLLSDDAGNDARLQRRRDAFAGGSSEARAGAPQ